MIILNANEDGKQLDVRRFSEHITEESKPTDIMTSKQVELKSLSLDAWGVSILAWE